MKHYLNDLVYAEDIQRFITWTMEDEISAKRLAYKIRDALHSARHFGIPHLEDLRDKWRIRVQLKIVIAERRIDKEALKIASDVDLYTIDDLTDSIDVVMKLMKMNTIKPITITNLPETDLIQVEAWAKKNNYSTKRTERTLIIEKNIASTETTSGSSKDSIESHGFFRNDDV